nr:hypothetical protein CFP56_39843 [Quercus suber]
MGTDEAFHFNPLEEDETFSDDELDELSEGVAVVRFSGVDKARLRGRWAFALIIKPFGRNVGFHFLHNKIMALWKPAGRMECIDLDFGFYPIRFGLTEDYDKVLREGPWFIGDQFLSIRAWELYFKPAFAKCSSIAVWVRFSQLPIEFFEQIALKEIGQAIGPVLRIDTHTLPLSREAALLVSVSRVGHKREACPYLVHEVVHVDSPEMDISTPSPPSPTRDATSEVYDPWTLVSRRKDKYPKTRAYPVPQTQPSNPQNGDSKPSPLSRSPSRGPRDAKRKNPVGHCDTSSYPKPSHPYCKMGHDFAMSSYTSLKQSPPLIAFSFGEPHSLKNTPNPNISVSPKHAPNPKSKQNKHGQSNQLKGKGKVTRKPRNTGMGNLLQREDNCHLKNHDRRDQSNPNLHHGLV